MKETIQGNDYCVEFKSIEEFYNYLCDTPFNNAFKNNKKSSADNGFDFTKTYSFEEAVDLLHNGWAYMSEQLEKTLLTQKISTGNEFKTKSSYDVVGFQACVPRYLQGIPTNMINQKRVVSKQKTITINKSINYDASISTEQIIAESLKVLKIVKKIESQGIRVNLNVILGTYKDVSIFCKVRVKNAGERLNVSKLAFCLVHPSMLRRIFFRFIEVYPYATSQFVIGYGIPVSNARMLEKCKGEYLFPAFISDDINNLTDLNKFKA